MVRLPDTSRLEGRTAFVGFLLVGALVLVALLAYQAADASRSHADAVRKTLTEQAQFAAWEYANNVRRTLDAKVLYHGLDVVAFCSGKVAGAPLDLETIQAAARDLDWAAAEATSTYFRLDLESGEVVLAGRAHPELSDWVRHDLRSHFEGGVGPGWEPVLVEVPRTSGFAAYRFYPEARSDAEVVYGFVMGRDGLNPQFIYSLATAPLLPQGLTGGRPNREVFAVSIEDSAGRRVWRSDTTYASEFEARDTLGARYAGLTARVVVNPDVAPSLVIGGLPGSRLPLILTLLVLTAGLVTGAFFQLRREAELARLRADFVSGVSHELRTPLAQIRMFGETLLLDRVRTEEERRRSLEIIVNESRRLTHQVGNVLLYSHKERDGVQADPQPTDVDRLVRDVAETFEPLARSAGSTLEVEMEAIGTASIDPLLVRQALLNLLDNAVKYGRNGQTIRLGGEPEGAGLRLWVEDEGEGVAEEDRGRIWQAYYRLRRHRESSVAGSGIGLSVVAEIAQAHGGKAHVVTGRTGGARFELEFPKSE